MTRLADLIAGNAPLPVAAQHVILQAGRDGQIALLRGPPCDARLTSELLRKPQSAPLTEDLIGRHIDGVGLGVFLSKAERRKGVLAAAVRHFVLTPGQQARLMQLPTSTHQSIKEMMLVSGWATPATTIGALRTFELRDQLTYLGSERCHPELTDEQVWQVLTAGERSLLMFRAADRQAARPPGSLPQRLRAARLPQHLRATGQQMRLSGALGQRMRARAVADARQGVAARRTRDSQDLNDRALALHLIRLLLLRPALRDCALDLARAGSWVAMGALAHVPLTGDQQSDLVEQIIFWWPADQGPEHCATWALEAVYTQTALPSALRARLALLSAATPSRWEGETSQYVMFQALRSLIEVNEQIRSGQSGRRCAASAVALLADMTRPANQLVPPGLVAHVGYDWWLSLTPQRQVRLPQRELFAAERLRRAIRDAAQDVGRTGEAVRMIWPAPEPELGRLLRPHAGVCTAQTWDMAQAAQSRPWDWSQHSGQVAQWFAEQLGEDVARWECAMALSCTFTGTFEELVQTVDLLQSFGEQAA